jgi:flagellar hook-basal body complex protein FliE
LLKEAAGDVGDALHKSEAASLQAVTGKPDLAQVAAAVNNAKTTFTEQLMGRIVSG